MLAYDGLELDVGDPGVPEELIARLDQVGQVPVRDEALALVELHQVGTVHALVPEHAVNGKVICIFTHYIPNKEWLGLAPLTPRCPAGRTREGRRSRCAITLGDKFPVGRGAGAGRRG